MSFSAPAVSTTRGMTEQNMILIGQFMVEALRCREQDAALEVIGVRIREFCRRYLKFRVSAAY
jgi:glycine/serine hydroxymethyltransferase